MGEWGAKILAWDTSQFLLGSSGGAEAQWPQQIRGQEHLGKNLRFGVQHARKQQPAAPTRHIGSEQLLPRTFDMQMRKLKADF
jgi:hypothetical protein